ncbi:hypothetical protein J504_0962 [Acinetobacter baumannii 348935]|nr:hypothetical protein J504_0962 [Acinetobacter baumannii 348935]
MNLFKRSANLKSRKYLKMVQEVLWFRRQKFHNWDNFES